MPPFGCRRMHYRAPYAFGASPCRGAAAMRAALRDTGPAAAWGEGQPADQGRFIRPPCPPRTIPRLAVRLAGQGHLHPPGPSGSIHSEASRPGASRQCGRPAGRPGAPPVLAHAVPVPASPPSCRPRASRLTPPRYTTLTGRAGRGSSERMLRFLGGDHHAGRDHRPRRRGREPRQEPRNVSVSVTPFPSVTIASAGHRNHRADRLVLRAQGTAAGTSTGAPWSR